MTFSVVAPVFDEEAVVAELARRCLDAAERIGVPHEVIVVDDASRDGTAETLEAAARREGWGERLRLLRLPSNRGQAGATRAGLAAARGDWIAVLDGDLQDPPEVLTDLWEARGDDGADVVFAVKTGRAERGLLRVGLAAFHGLQRALGSDTPPGAGSYCLLRRAVARRVAEVDAGHANLSAVLGAMARPYATVPYDKQGRYDEASRVGLAGLACEGLVSLALTGALGRALGLAAAGGLVAGGTMRTFRVPGSRAVLGLGAAAGVGWWLVERSAAPVRRVLRAPL
ncbi:MAG: glycosyltransferase [Myxococcota bacterium]